MPPKVSPDETRIIELHEDGFFVLGESGATAMFKKKGLHLHPFNLSLQKTYCEKNLQHTPRCWRNKRRKKQMEHDLEEGYDKMDDAPFISFVKDYHISCNLNQKAIREKKEIKINYLK